MADDNNMQDWAADCNGEGRERVVRDGRDSGEVMMAVVVEDGGCKQQWQRRTTIVAEKNVMQDWVADYNGEGQKWVVREGGDSRVAMMAAAAEDGSGEQRWWWWRTTAIVDKNSGGQQRRRMMMACKIKQQTTRSKEESGWQTTAALGPPGRECEKIKKSGLHKKAFFSNTVCPVGVFAPA